MRNRHQAHRIAVGTDGSENAHQAVTWAIENSQPGDTVILIHVWHPYVYGSELGAVYTIDDSGAAALLDEEFEKHLPLAKEHEIMLKKDLVQGDARNALQNANADLVVVGARGHSGLSGLLLGSVADYISKHSDVPVVIVPTKK